MKNNISFLNKKQNKIIQRLYKEYVCSLLGKNIAISDNFSTLHFTCYGPKEMVSSITWWTRSIYYDLLKQEKESKNLTRIKNELFET